MIGWFARVPSSSNIADLPSRGCWKSLRSLLGPLGTLEVVEPFCFVTHRKLGILPESSMTSEQKDGVDKNSWSESGENTSWSERSLESRMKLESTSNSQGPSSFGLVQRRFAKLALPYASVRRVAPRDSNSWLSIQEKKWALAITCAINVFLWCSHVLVLHVNSTVS